MSQCRPSDTARIVYRSINIVRMIAQYCEYYRHIVNDINQSNPSSITGHKYHSIRQFRIIPVNMSNITLPSRFIILVPIEMGGFGTFICFNEIRHGISLTLIPFKYIACQTKLFYDLTTSFVLCIRGVCALISLQPLL